MVTHPVFDPESLVPLVTPKLKSAINNLSIYNLNKAYLYYTNKIDECDDKKSKDYLKYKRIVELIQKQCYILNLDKRYNIYF